MLDLSHIIDVIYAWTKVISIVITVITTTIFIFNFNRVLKYLRRWLLRKNKPSTDNFDFSRLPTPTTELVGRSKELTALTNALKNKQLVHICASGGVGKSALIFEWLQRIQPKYHGAEKVLAWSFYSQGSPDAQNSAVPFFQVALPFFGYAGEFPKDDVAKGRALAKCLRNQSFILILDGLEPLQHPAHILDGELRDTALRAFFDEVRDHGLEKSPSLMVIASEQPLVELQNWSEKQYVKLDLPTLSPSDGVKLLRKLQVIGTDEELVQAARDMGDHALALILLGKMLVSQFEGNIARRDQLPALEEAEQLGGHVWQVLQWYADFYRENNTSEVNFLDLLSLFDGPMQLAEKNILVEQADCAAPLRTLSEVAWQHLEEILETAGLLTPSADTRIQWECHPLIRSYFGQQFQATSPDHFRQAHHVLFEYYQRIPEKQQPDTLAELEPLYRAVRHGCLAGEYKKALYEVYWARINHGKEVYSLHKLGAYSQDLTALAAFFPDGWLQPVQQELSEADRGWLLATASFCLMSLGRLVEAVAPRQADLEIAAKLEDWKNAAITAQNLVDLLLPLGRLTEAAIAAQYAVDYATRSGDLGEQVISHAYFATVCHRQGQFPEAEQAFITAEGLQQEAQTDSPQLCLLPGFQYCALLLDQAVDLAGIQQVVARGEYSLKMGIAETHLITISLDQLTLACAYFKLEEYEQAATYFEEAVAGVRQSGRVDHLVYFLIDRANFSLQQQRFTEAKQDLAEAWQMIARSRLNLYAVDYHLAMCRYARLQQPSDAQQHLETAKALIAETGYHLRDKAVRELSE